MKEKKPSLFRFLWKYRSSMISEVRTRGIIGCIIIILVLCFPLFLFRVKRDQHENLFKSWKLYKMKGEEIEIPCDKEKVG